MIKRYALFSFALLLSGVLAVVVWPSGSPVPPFLKLADRKLAPDWEKTGLANLLSQLAWVEGSTRDFGSPMAVRSFIRQYRPGGLLLSDMTGSEWQQLGELPGNSPENQPIAGTPAYPFLPGSGPDVPLLSQAILQEVGDRQLLQKWNEKALLQSRQSGLGYRVIPASQLQPEFWNENGILAFAGLSVGLWVDTLQALDAIEEQLAPLVRRGLAGIRMDSSLYARVPVHPDTWKRLFRDQLEFHGLILATYHTPPKLKSQLRSGVDLWAVSPADLPLFQSNLRSLALEPGSAAAWARRFERILKAKTWVARHRQEQGAPEKPLPPEEPFPGEAAIVPASYEREKWEVDNRWSHLSWSWTRSAMALLANPKEMLPLTKIGQKQFHIWELSRESFSSFQGSFARYADFEVHQIDTERLPLRPFDVQQTPMDVHIVLMDQDQYSESTHGDFIRSLRHYARHNPMVLVHFGAPDQLRHWGTEAALVHAAQRTQEAETLAADLLFGAFAPQGRLPYALNAHFPAGHGLTLEKVRVQYVPTQALDVLPEKLVGIDAIVNTAIDKKAFPGCQVAIAYRGDILYSKAFGHHTYDGDAPRVRENDLYDLASLTKVSATTLMAMQLHNKGILDLHKPIGRYLDLPDNSRMAGIPVSRLMTHQSGLRANFPIVSYVRSKRKTKVDCQYIYCDQEKDGFSVAITDNLFFSEKHQAIIEEKIWNYAPKYGKRYRYSDLNFFLLQQILENQSGQTLDEWVDEHLRGELGLRNLTFRPKERFPLTRLVPTEKDKKWRMELVHGYVHDEAASLFGGVSGHAGLFANAEDLAALFQLVLNEGTYGQSTLFGPATAKLFTEHYANSHRGLGFDKPTFANKSSRSSRISEKGYGHTGFTGTCVWVDPEKELVFVFLSNRIYPDKNNHKLQDLWIRRRIHDVVYQALGTLDEDKALERELVSQAVVE